MARIHTSSVQHVKNCWGDDAPEWVVNLAKSCDEASQKDMASKIGRSSALINQVLQKKYPGRLDRVEADVVRVLNDCPITCPLLGQITPSQCLNNQKLPYSGANHQSVALFRACRKCPNNSKNQGERS